MNLSSVCLYNTKENFFYIIRVIPTAAAAIEGILYRCDIYCNNFPIEFEMKLFLNGIEDFVSPIRASGSEKESDETLLRAYKTTQLGL